MEKDLDNVEEGKLNGLKSLMNFIKISKNMCKVQKPKWKKSKLKMNLQGKIVKNVDHQWSLKWDDMGSSWLVRNFPDCRNTKAIVKEIGVTCPKCKEGQIVERKSKKSGFFMDVIRYPECEFVSWDKPITKTMSEM